MKTKPDQSSDVAKLRHGTEAQLSRSKPKKATAPIRKKAGVKLPVDGMKASPLPNRKFSGSKKITHKNPHILIVDDDPSLLVTMRDVLKMKGFEPFSAQTGSAALDMLEGHDFDVALIDLRLNDISGLDLLSDIRTRSPETKCILLTGYATQNSAIKAIQMNAFGYFQKPFDMEQVLLSIHQAVDKRKAEKSLRESEERYRTVIDSANDAIVSSDSAGKIVGWNRGAEIIFGYPESEALGLPLTTLMPSRFHDSHAMGMTRVQTGGEKHVIGKTIEITGLRKDGSEFPLEISLSEWQSDNDRFYTAIMREISERKHAEDNIHKAEGKYRTLVEQIHPIVYIAPPNQHIGVTYISPQIKTLGFTEEEWVADPELWLRQIHPDDQVKVMEYLERESQSKEPYKLEYRLRTRDGAVRWFLDEVMDIADEYGNILFRQGFMLDITERKQAENEIQQREHFLALLNNMTHSIIAAQNFDELMQILANDLIALLEADNCYITRWDPIKEQVYPVATNATADYPFLTMKYPKGDKNLTISTLEAGHVLVIENTVETPYASPQLIQQFHEQSFISIPLIYGGHKLGAAIVGFKKARQFLQKEIEHAQQASDQIALAVWNAQQDFELKKHLQEVETLAHISRALSETEKIGLPTVLQLIVDSARELIPGSEQAVIHLLDKEEQLLSAQAVSGYDNTNPNWRLAKIRPNQGIAGQVIVSGQTINIADVEKDPRFITYATPPKYHSLMVAPVQTGEQKLGTISVQSTAVNEFTEAESRLLSALGTQAATAIENAHLLESIQQALKESNALYRINQGLVASLDSEKLLKDVVELLQKTFNYYHVQIYVLDPETGDFVMQEGSGEIGRQLKEQGYRLKAGEGIVGYTADTNEAFFTNDVDKTLSFMRNPLLPDIKSELAVPVKIDGQILGLLDIQQVPPAYISQNDLRLVTAVADQLAISLQKANLLTELQAALQVETAIRNQMVQSERLVTMGRLLASVSHELNNPLQAIQNALFLLREEKGISPQGKLDLDIVLSEAERMSALIERLRTTYRPTQAEDFQATQINNIIEDVCALISTHLRHNEIAFEFHPEPDLPLIPALADQIRQVIMNLLMNAVEAMSTGGILTVCTKVLQDSNEILLTVSDTGTGIPTEILPNIFDAFVTNKQAGTGLGLTITYDIVIKHNGRITAENNPDKGSTFKVWLPINNSEIE